ncbi:MAG: SAV_2336 N-terminal domain-related protein [Xenococcaceae cyanobacterium]
MSKPLNQLIAALSSHVKSDAGRNLDLTGQEIAEILWLLLRRLERGEPTSSFQKPVEEEKGETTAAEETKTSSGDLPNEEATGELYPKTRSIQRQLQLSARGEVLSLPVPDAPSLREPLALAQALRPLMRRVPTGTEEILDEIATVHRIAEEGIYFPVMGPALEPWLDVALVVDESDTMVIWRHTIRQLKRFLEHYGAFRDVRTWGLVTDETGEVRIRRGIGAGADQQFFSSAGELVDPSGRRLVLVVSDCVTEMWRNGKVLPVLETWSKSSPTAIVQTLPERMWLGTGLRRGTAVRLQGLTPGVANQNLIVTEQLLPNENDLNGGIKLPVLNLEPKVAGVWSQMVAGKGHIAASGFIFLPEIETEATEFKTEEVPLGVEERVHRFRMTASPLARRLAELLAAAPMINLPIVRLIQETLLEKSHQVHVAEVFLGGLLRPLSSIKVDTNPDEVQYDFIADQMRDLLLKFASDRETLSVIDAVSKYVASQLGKSLEEFAGLLKAPQIGEQGQMKPIALITAKVLKRLGGDYGRFAQELEREWSSARDYSQLEQPLQVFEFKILSVNRRGEITKRETKTARYYTETLPNGVTLKMVAIPGGTFLMGSSEKEEGRYEYESPQHKVTVQPFFMGKFQVTQAQWRAIASLPKVNLDLKPEPSRFKGDDRPVEQVSWYDAVEFCERLSRETGRSYRLPSEAEWEYACRAGTTTPFHFGETITTDLANYDAGETTSVGSFSPNAFGLYDMHGLVWEWCLDPWHDNYEGAPGDGSVWDEENRNDNHSQNISENLELFLKDERSRILRGGSWVNIPRDCRSAVRILNSPRVDSNYSGFRVVCGVPRTL